MKVCFVTGIKVVYLTKYINSGWVPIKAGVPQGSIKGYLFFLHVYK